MAGFDARSMRFPFSLVEAQYVGTPRQSSQTKSGRVTVDILHLAVRGKLVPQDQTDEPASELLKRIAAAKARLVKAGQIRKEKPLPEIERDEAPYDAPQSWEWVRLGNATHIVQGFAFLSADFSPDPDAGLPLIKIGDIGSNNPEVFIRGQHDPAYVVNRGNILLGLSGSIKCAVWEGPPALLNQRIARIMGVSGGLHARWLLFCVDACIEKWKNETSKLTVQNVKAGQLYEAEIPVPPLAEQHRIVAKVDEMMALCDRLEAARSEREATRDRLAAASLARLNSPDPDPATFSDHARFALESLAAFTTRPDQVKQLRQTILNLAVRGKLVPQDPNDEQVDVLVTAADRKRKQITSKDRRASPNQQELLAKELRWDIPETWTWRGLADLVLFVDYRGRTPPKTAKGIRLITAKNVKQGAISLTPEEFVSDPTYRDWMTRGFPQLGDVLFTTEAPMGNAAVVDLTETFALAQRVICLQSYGATDAAFLTLVFLSEPFQSILDATGTGLTAKGIKAAKLKRLPIAIPPLAEQHRIVAKVDALMALCDRLEASLTDAQDHSRRLLDALLAEALTPTEAAMQAEAPRVAAHG
jgi:type I restriction enzyme, S subunit